MRRSTSTPIETITNANSVPMLTRLPSTLIGVNPAASATMSPVTIVVRCGVPEARVNPARPRRQQAVLRHRHEDARLRQHLHHHRRREPGDDADLDERRHRRSCSPPSAVPRRGRARVIDRDGHRRRAAELAYGTRPTITADDGDVEHRADRQRSEDAARHVALRIARFLRRRRDRVEADVGEEDHRRAADDARPAELAERRRCSAE